MLLELRTGLRGAGKTLGAVEYLIEHKKKGDWRPVYALGITGLREDLATPITFDDLKNWKEKFGAGSIVLVDECQKYMPVRRSGDPPSWISDLSESRHYAVDFILITQHPLLIDSYVRRLVDSHVHTVRKWRTEAVQRFQWPTCMDDPVSKSAVKQAESKTWHNYTEEAKNSYKSSELHTVQANVPRYVKVAVVLVITIPLAIFFAVQYLRHTGKDHKDGSASSSPASASSTPSTSTLFDGGSTAKKTPDLTPSQWVHRQVPRVAGIPWSAPIYDDQKVQSQPDLYCMKYETDDGRQDNCTCLTEQGTKATVPHVMCLAFAEGGVYNPYRAPIGAMASSAGPAPAQPSAASPAGSPGQYPTSVPQDAGSRTDWPAGVGQQAYRAPGEPGGTYNAEYTAPRGSG